MTAPQATMVKGADDASSSAEDENEAVMLKSSLWKTLFRAGYQPAKVVERSLSGRFVRSLSSSHLPYYLHCSSVTRKMYLSLGKSLE